MTNDLYVKRRLDGTSVSVVKIPTGMRTRLILQRPRIVRLEHTHFRYAKDSAIAVPAPWNGWRHPCAALAIVALHLRHHPGVLVLCGHTSQTGSDAHNDKLSQDRVIAIRALVAQARDEWIDVATRSGSLLDIKAYITYLHDRRGWPCTPSVLDEAADEDAKRAVLEFQRAYNARFGQTIDEDGICGEHTLGAAFEVQQFELKAWLGKFGLTHGDLSLADENLIGAGSTFAGKVDMYPEDEASDRIVDVLCVDPTDLEGLEVTPELLYSKIPRYDLLPVEDDGGDWEFGSLLIVTDLCPDDVDLEERYRLISDDGSYDVELTTSVDGLVKNGGIELQFEGVPTLPRYNLLVTSREGVTSTAFQDIAYSEFHSLSTSLPSEVPET